MPWDILIDVRWVERFPCLIIDNAGSGPGGVGAICRGNREELAGSVRFGGYS